MTPDTITVRFLGRDVALERIDTTMLRYEGDVDGLDLEIKRPYSDAGYWCASFEGTHSLIDADIQGAVDSLTERLTVLVKVLAPLLEGE